MSKSNWDIGNIADQTGKVIIVTDLQRHSGSFQFLSKIFAMKVDVGVLPTLRAAFDKNAKPGDFFGPGGKFHLRGYPVAHKSNKLSYDEEIAQKLWDISEELTGVKF